MRKMSKKHLAVFVISLSLIGLVTPATASDYGCRTFPKLSQSRLVSNKNLGYGVSAQAWQWYPDNNDAANAGVSPLGTKVSVVSANLRNTTFGITHSTIPTTQDLRTMSYALPNALATINGDYFDQNGAWNSMVEQSALSYAIPEESSVIGVGSVPINKATGYRAYGILTIGTAQYPITGVNQVRPGPESIVVYKTNYVDSLTPAGDLTLVVQSGKITKIYPKGLNVPTSAGTVIQVRGSSVNELSKVALKARASVNLGLTPRNEMRMAADSVTPTATIISRGRTINISAVNFGQILPSGATLYTDSYVNPTPMGRVTIRIMPNNAGRYYIANVYKQGLSMKVDPGGFIVQANGNAANTASLFKAGYNVTVNRTFSSTNNSVLLNAAGRGPRLVENSKLIWVCTQHSLDFRPRSAIGWNQDGQVWFMTSSRGADADDMGFRAGGSSSDQMGHWLISLGATDAVLLDGGGSTTMEIKDPSSGWQRFDIPDSAWYRPLANAFVISTKH